MSRPRADEVALHVLVIMANFSLVAAAAGVLAASPARTSSRAETLISGCNERNIGEIGIRELAANVGDTVCVAVTVHSSNEIDSFSLDVAFPTDLLRYVDTAPGDLTEDFFLFSGSYLPGQGQVRVSGAHIAPIASGTTGLLARIRFEVAAPGTGVFETGDYLDDISGYVACEDVHPPTALNGSSWGTLKSRFRAGQAVRSPARASAPSGSLLLPSGQGAPSRETEPSDEAARSSAP
jgi:hypothetical protein